VTKGLCRPPPVPPAPRGGLRGFWRSDCTGHCHFIQKLEKPAGSGSSRSSIPFTAGLAQKTADPERLAALGPKDATGCRL